MIFELFLHKNDVIISGTFLKLKGVVMSDLQFCRAISGKSEPCAIIPKMPICRSILNLAKKYITNYF